MKVVLYVVLGAVWAALGVAFLVLDIGQPAPFGGSAFWISETILVWIGGPLQLVYYLRFVKGKRQ